MPVVVTGLEESRHSRAALDFTGWLDDMWSD